MKTDHTQMPTSQAKRYTSPTVQQFGTAIELTLDGGCSGCDNLRHRGNTRVV